MSKIIKSEMYDEMTTIELENGKILTLKLEQNHKGYEISFYEDKYLELPYSNATFVFTDESVGDEDHDDFYNTSEGNSFLLREMKVPSGLECMGIGTFIVEWIIEVSGANIWARDPSYGKADDERNLTDEGLKFVFAMQEKGLIQKWD